MNEAVEAARMKADDFVIDMEWNKSNNYYSSVNARSTLIENNPITQWKRRDRCHAI